ncbi:hypothetical protein C8R44DRAFT_553211, partial [Mycena epipterygia]
LPTEAMEFIDSAFPQGEKAETDESGLFVKMEWSRFADWFNLDKDWMAWIPVLDEPGESGSWYFSTFSKVSVGRADFDNYIIPSELQETIATDLKIGWNCLQAIKHSPLFPARAPHPTEFRYDSLNFAKDSEQEVLAELMRAAWKMLEYLGFINWWTRTQEGWQYVTDHNCHDDIDHFQLSRFSRRGVILNLARDWKGINLPMLLEHDVPVFYPWTQREECHARFGRLAPTLLQAYVSKKKLWGGIDFPALEGEFRNTASGCLLFGFDIFLEEIEGSAASAYIIGNRLRNSWRCFVILHKGWKRKEVITHTEKQWCCRHFDFTYQGGWDTDDVVLTFYAYRPTDHHDFQLPSLPDDRFRSEAQLAVLDAVADIREMEKPVVIKPSQPSLTLTERMEIPTDIVMDDREQSSNVAPPTAPRAFRQAVAARRKERYPSKSPSCCEGPSREIRARGYLDSRSRASSRRRSASPVRSGSSLGSRRSSPPRSMYRRPNPQQDVILTTWLESESAKRISDNKITFRIPAECKWNLKFLERAVLVITDVPTRVRFRYWACSLGPFHDFKDLLNLGIARGATFKLAIRAQDAELFHPANLEPERRILEAKLYDFNAEEPALMWNGGGLAFARTWEKRTMNIFDRGHARALTGAGGSLGWIGRRLMPGKMISGFMAGPSSQVTVHQRCWTDSGDRNSMCLLADEVSAQEIDVILGHLKSDRHDQERWLFPPADMLWELSDHYSGELNEGWNTTMEMIMEEIESGEPQARTRGGMRELFRNGHRGNKAPLLSKLSRAEFREQDKML